MGLLINDTAPDFEADTTEGRIIADEVVQAIQKLSGQEYVPMYASVRKEQIAAEAGVSKQTLLRHFGSREGLSRAAMEREKAMMAPSTSSA